MSRTNYVRNLQSFKWPQKSGLVREVDAFACRLVWIVRIVISLFYPCRLLRQLLCALEVVRMEFFRTYVVIGIGVTEIACPLCLLGSNAVFVTLIENDARSNGRDYKRGQQHQLDSLFRLRSHVTQNVTDRGSAGSLAERRWLLPLSRQASDTTEAAASSRCTLDLRITACQSLKKMFWAP